MLNRSHVFNRANLLPRYRSLDARSEVSQRRSWLETVANAELEALALSDRYAEESSESVENLFGHVPVPLGVAGPLEVRGRHAEGTFYVPLATTETALVKSYERGSLVLSRSGGVRVQALSQSVHVTPVFSFENLAEAIDAARWIESNEQSLRSVAEQGSRHTKLRSLSCTPLGRLLYLTCAYETGDANGSNMVNTATYKICDELSGRFPTATYRARSNLSSDKKSAHVHNFLGYGHRVTAEAHVSRQLLSRYMRATPEDVAETWRLCAIGAMQAGALGMNAHAVNGLTALYIATGQDVAQITNSSNAITLIEADADGLYLSVTLPSLMAATTGGGTQLAAPGACLDLLGCRGSGSVNKFVEIAAALVLAGELSLAAALHTGDHRQAHAAASEMTKLRTERSE